VNLIPLLADFIYNKLFLVKSFSIPKYSYLVIMESLHFVSSNRNKYLEIQSHLQKYGVVVEFSNQRLIEIQSDSIKEIAVEKSKRAFALLSKPIIVEDDGLFIDELGGFPGQYSSYAYKTIGNNGILKLLSNSKQRFAAFKSFFAFCSDGENPLGFEGEVEGKVSYNITEGGWGYDPIFIPDGSSLTFGQLQMIDRKIEFSHRSKALSKFAQWYKQKYE
jgi:XTP/dITP diphosphohydrolase